MKRMRDKLFLDPVIELARSFSIPTVAIINKYDLDEDITDKISDYHKGKGIQLIAKVPSLSTGQQS